MAKEKLSRSEAEMDNLEKMVSGKAIKDERFSQYILMTTVRLQKEADVFSQRQTILIIETALIPPATQSAKAIEAVYASDRPISPKKGLLLMLGAIGGLMAGVLSVFIGDAWRRRKVVS